MTAVVSRSLPDRVVARAMILSMDPELSPDARADSLLATSRGNVGALERALKRIERGSLDRPSRFAVVAGEALQLALHLAGAGPATAEPSPAETQAAR